MMITWLRLTCLAWMAVTAFASVAPPLEDLIYYLPERIKLYDKIACTPQEWECFKTRKLLHEADGQCYPVGERGPCAESRIFYANRTEFSRRGGHLRGTCASVCEDDFQAPFIATGQCLTRSQVEAQFCRSEWYLRAEKDAFGQWVCLWTHLPCPLAEGVPTRIWLGDWEYTDPNSNLCHPPDIFTIFVSYNTTFVPDPVTPEAPAHHPLLQAFGNTCYLQREFACSEEERACLQYGRLLRKGSCYKTGSYIYKSGKYHAWHLDCEKALRAGGRLRGTFEGKACAAEPAGGCARNAVGNDTVCRREWGMLPETGVFGKVCYCEVRRHSSPAPPPPPSPGFCRAPDFQHPTPTPAFDLTLAVGLSWQCSAEEHACLREGRVLAGGACHALRTRGPCAEGEELVLDKEDLAQRRLQPVCKARPCPEGSVLLPATGECLTHQQVVALLCPESSVGLDEFGGWQCLSSTAWPGNLPATARYDNGTCVLPEHGALYWFRVEIEEP